MNLFKDIIPSILQGKTPVLQTADDFKSYVPFQVNRALSYYSDCIYFANEMNRLHMLPEKMQHDFYFYGLRKYKRPFPGKWAKKLDDDAENVKAIMEKTGYSYQKAMDILPLLDDEQLVKLHKEFDKGGKA